jgi:threonyl-tRNA synthetase
MIHRALYGSLERFFAVLVEHYAGAFPLWLAPVQARVLTVSEKQDAYAQSVVDALKKAGLRAELDVSADKLGAKIRRAQLEKIPYMVVCGDKEVAESKVAPRTREGKQLEPMPLEAFIGHIIQEARIPKGGPGR